MKTIIELIKTDLYNTKRNKVETQRIKESWFIKRNLSLEWDTYKDIFLDKKRLMKVFLEAGVNKLTDEYSYSEKCNLEICNNQCVFISASNGYKKYCSRKCSIAGIKQTNLERYGSSAPLGNKEIREKMKRTNLERYGVEYITQNKEIREKVTKTNLERYGSVAPSGNKDVLLKMEQTNLERYGSVAPSGNKDVLLKMEQTNLERYGVKNVFQNEEIKAKSRVSRKEKYGGEYTLSIGSSLIERVKRTNIERYGFDVAMKSEEISMKALETKLNDIDEAGLNSFERAIIKSIKTRREDIDEAGLNSFERVTKTRREDIDEAGLNSFERVTKTRREDIDEAGLNSFERAGIKSIKTKLNDIDEAGLNSFERVTKTRREDIDEAGLNSFERAGIKGNEKRRITNESSGRWITESEVKDFKDYSRLVWRYTRQNDLSSLDNIELRGTGFHEFHLDHKYSIFEGYKYSVPPEIIGHIGNLEMLNSRVNMSKNIKCSITLEELLDATS